MERCPCPLGCPEDDHLVLEAPDRLHGVAGRFSVVRCGSCGLLRTNPRPTPVEIGAFYPNDYAPHQDSEAPGADADSGRHAWLKRILALQPRATPPVRPGRLLEVGCAGGGYLESMRRAGWVAEGIEFSERAATKARAKGFRVQTAQIESAEPPAQPPDLIAAWMVLEHLHEPVHALSRMREWIAPGGYLIASVPDAGALERRLFGERWYALQVPTHLFHYTPITFEKLLQASGWTLERVRWQRNCMNLLNSLEYVAHDTNRPWLQRWVRWLRSPAAGRVRVVLGWVLGAMRQSGRIEIWARPATAENI